MIRAKEIGEKERFSHILTLLHRIVLHHGAVGAYDCGVDPIFGIFAHEAVASQDKSFEKAVLSHGVFRVLGTAWVVVATRSICGGDHILVEVDHDVAEGP